MKVSFPDIRSLSRLLSTEATRSKTSSFKWTYQANASISIPIPFGFEICVKKKLNTVWVAFDLWLARPLNVGKSNCAVR